MYRASWPYARLLGRLGVPLEVKVFVHFDVEAGVFVGVSPDVAGLVVEAGSLDELAKEVSDLVPAMLSTDQKAAGTVVATRLSYTAPVHCA